MRRGSIIGCPPSRNSSGGRLQRANCIYIALAEREGVTFWTSDQRIYHALSAHFPFIRLVADYLPQR